MATKFQTKSLFSAEELHNIVQNFGFKRISEVEIARAIDMAFSDYILAALAEQGADAGTNRRLYMEAAHFMDKSSKLLAGMPHPAGKMSYRLADMVDTLNKLIEGKSFAAERATRFMEKNLVRKLRDLWAANTSTPFHAGGDGSGKNPRNFLLACFDAAERQYPEITWFGEVEYDIADALIKSIKR